MTPILDPTAMREAAAKRVEACVPRGGHARQIRQSLAALAAEIRALPTQQAAEPRGERERFEVLIASIYHIHARAQWNHVVVKDDPIVTHNKSQAWVSAVLSAYDAALATPSASPTEDARDAARYRWLRDEDLGVPDGMREIYVVQMRLPHTECMDTDLFGTALDAAIDAALAAQPLKDTP